MRVNNDEWNIMRCEFNKNNVDKLTFSITCLREMILTFRGMNNGSNLSCLLGGDGGGGGEGRFFMRFLCSFVVPIVACGLRILDKILCGFSVFSYFELRFCGFYRSKALKEFHVP